MKQSDIKTECEHAYKNIKLQEDKIKRLQSICKHPNTHSGSHPYYRSICSDCGEVVSTEWQKLQKINREDI